MDLRDAIGKYYNIDASNIFVGNGSDEILAFIFQGFLSNSTPILFPNITYSFYPVYCKLFQIIFQSIPLNSNFEIELNDYLIPNGGIIFPNPNAPTGIPMQLRKIDKFLKSNNDSALLVRGEDIYKNFKTDIIAKNDFDDDGYERLLERNEHYNKTIREK